MGPGQDPDGALEVGALRVRVKALMGPGQDPYGPLSARTRILTVP